MSSVPSSGLRRMPGTGALDENVSWGVGGVWLFGDLGTRVRWLEQEHVTVRKRRWVQWGYSECGGLVHILVSSSAFCEGVTARFLRSLKSSPSSGHAVRWSSNSVASPINQSIQPDFEARMFVLCWS